MANPYFRFKQFTIYQEHCAMKVCTDSCLLGGRAAHWLAQNKPGVSNILDIGAGTGLLSLMLAQKMPVAIIDGVEIEPLCYGQATRNIFESPWQKRITIYNQDIICFDTQKQYEVIISNPPFYELDFMSDNHAKNIAHHNAGLTLKSFLKAVKKFLAADGCCFVLLPYQRSSEFEISVTEESFFIHNKTMIKQTAKHSFFRIIYLISRQEKETEEEQIIIKNEDNSYSPEFTLLLKDYYLYL